MLVCVRCFLKPWLINFKLNFTHRFRISQTTLWTRNPLLDTRDQIIKPTKFVIIDIRSFLKWNKFKMEFVLNIYYNLNLNKKQTPNFVQQQGTPAPLLIWLYQGNPWIVLTQLHRWRLPVQNTISFVWLRISKSRFYCLLFPNRFSSFWDIFVVHSTLIHIGVCVYELCMFKILI